MLGVLIGFAIIAVVVLTGYLVGRFGVLGAGADAVLSRLAFFVLSPPLLFGVVARADLPHMFSKQLPVAVVSSVAMFAIFLVVALVVWRRKVPEAVIGALSSGYQNAANIGIPVSVYVLGDGAASAPVILLQVILFGPVALTVLDLTTHGSVSARSVLLQPVKNPMIIASLLGLVCNLAGWMPPDPVMAPIDLVGAAAVPIILLAFGISLHGRRVLDPGSGHRRDVILATVLKLVAMPLVAWLFARFAFGLSGHDLFVATVLAGLPGAQNVFQYAQRYGRGVVIARDSVLITTILAPLTLVVVAALLAS